MEMNATPDSASISPLAIAIASILYGGSTFVSVPARADNTGVLEEVVVTARKRTESIQDIPASIDVFSKESIEKLAITQFEDYANRSPSLSFISAGPGSQYFFMRGASDGSNPEATSNSIAGYFLNDVSLSYYGVIPDLHLYDLQRIEVLNGPQGTLYGSGSMSGAVKLITNPPDPTAFSAGVDVDYSRFNAASGANHSEEGFVNVPLFDGTTAVRASAFYVKQAGFINNLLKTRTWVNGVVSDNSAWSGDNYNTQTYKGGRLALLHEFNDKWKLTLSGDYQAQRHNGAWDNDPARFGALNVARFGPEWGDNYNSIAQGKIEGDVGFADLIYIGGYSKSSLETVTEYSEYVQYVNTGSTSPDYIQGFACQSVDATVSPAAFTGCNNPYMYYDYRSDVKRFTNEVRLQSHGAGRTHWVLGAYLERTTNWFSNFYHMPGINFDGDQAAQYISNYGGDPFRTPGEWYANDNRTDEHQKAVFGELNYAVTDKIRVTAGARWFHATTVGNGYGNYFYQPRVDQPNEGAWSKTTFRAGIEYKPRENWLYYFSFAQGFREGAVNVGTGDNPSIPSQTEPDSLNTYELGWKTEFNEGRLRWNGAAYYTDWKKFQSAVFDLAISPNTFYANIGDARIFGVETSVEARPAAGLSLSLSGSYNNSRIVSNQFANPDYPVIAGERLPSVPFLKGSASIRYEVPFDADHRVYAQFDESYNGEMYNSLKVDVRRIQPAYALGSLRFGVNQANGRWGVEGYVSNITNKHAVIFINTYLYDGRETTNAPRSIGMRLKYRFGGSGN